METLTKISSNLSIGYISKVVTSYFPACLILHNSHEVESTQGVWASEWIRTCGTHTMEYYLTLNNSAIYSNVDGRWK